MCLKLLVAKFRILMDLELVRKMISVAAGTA
jgi:hypothetical protein